MRLSNFFKDVNGLESMTALMLFLSWPVASYVMVVNQSENLYYAYLAAFAGLAANKQWATRGNTNLVPDESQTAITGADTVITGDNIAVTKPVGRQKVRKR